MILVTGAAGKTGRAVITALRAQTADSVRAFVPNEAAAQVARRVGAAEVVIGDMLDAEMVDMAAHGAAAIYHICPNMHPAEVRMGELMIASARKAGAQRFVYHSVLHPHIEQMPHHWHKLKVEERLFEADLPFTILQPAPYMQNLLAHWKTITERGEYTNPYPPATPLSLVDLTDVAEVAAMVLTDPSHNWATYELVGTEALTQTNVAETLSEQLDRPVEAKQVPLDTWRQNAEAGGSLSAYAIEALVAMFEYYATYGLSGNPAVLAWLLGRSPTSLAEFARRA